MKVNCLVLISLICLGLSALTLQEYPRQEQQAPEVVFEEISQSQLKNHTNIQKLVFVTPWNSQGKRLTVKYANKLKYISPCWYQLVLRGDKVVFQNDQLIDHGYLEEIRHKNPGIKIIPRVYVSSFEVFRHLGTKEENFQTALNMIIGILQDNPQFDGIVWDSPYNLFIDDKAASPLNHLIHELVNTLKRKFQALPIQKRQQPVLFFNMANPSNRKLDGSLYRSLNVDGLLIQNYDSPLDFIQLLSNSVRWVKQVKPKARKIIMMLPFFSYKNDRGISTADAKKQLQTDGIRSSGFQRGMCKFISQKRNKYLVPCLQYFNQAYTILQMQNYCGGYWEGGNGLQNYYLFM